MMPRISSKKKNPVAIFGVVALVFIVILIFGILPFVLPNGVSFLKYGKNKGEDEQKEDEQKGKEGDVCSIDDGISFGNYKLNSDLDCELSTPKCISGYTFNEQNSVCELDTPNPLDNLTKVGTFDSDDLWTGSDSMFRLNVNEYIEAIPDDTIEDGINIVGMYLLPDKFVVYRRNEDSSNFETIWTYENQYQVWALKIYRDTGRVRLDGAPSPGSQAGEDNGSQWDSGSQTGTAPFRLDTDNNCPYVNLRDMDGQKINFIPNDVISAYCS